MEWSGGSILSARRASGLRCSWLPLLLLQAASAASAAADIREPIPIPQVEAVKPSSEPPERAVRGTRRPSYEELVDTYEQMEVRSAAERHPRARVVVAGAC